MLISHTQACPLIANDVQKQHAVRVSAAYESHISLMSAHTDHLPLVPAGTAKQW